MTNGYVKEGGAKDGRDGYMVRREVRFEYGSIEFAMNRLYPEGKDPISPVLRIGEGEAYIRSKDDLDVVIAMLRAGWRHWERFERPAREADAKGEMLKEGRGSERERTRTSPAAGKTSTSGP